MKIRQCVWGLMLLGWALAFSPLGGAKEIVRDGRCLERLAQGASFIVDGVCAGTEDRLLETERGTWPVAVTTIQVLDVFKGNASEGEDLQVTQLGWSRPNPNFSVYIPLTGERCEVGNRYIFFIHAKSRLGLSSFVAASAGIFSVSTQADGELVVENGLGNSGLLTCEGMRDEEGRDFRTQTEGPVSYSNFIDLIEGLSQ